MELASRSLVEELARTGHSGPKRRRAAQQRPAMLPVASGPADRQRPCKCGTCARCRDNARWERIFQEKFADPTYYQECAPKQGSSLSWL
jgi:hypothetical protein